MLTDCVYSDKREYLPTGITEMFSSLDFIERGYSLCILGESDAGKSYLAIAIVNLPPRKMMGIDSEGMLISAVHEEDGHEGLNLLMVNDRIPAGAKLY